MGVGRGVLKRYSSTISALARALDVLACVTGGLLAYYLRFSNWGFTLGYPALILIGVLLVLIIFPIAGVYQSWRSQGLLAAAGRVLVAWIIVFMLLMVLLVAVKHAEHFSRLWMMGWFAWVGLFVVVLRLATFSALHMLRRHGFNRRQVVIIGDGNQARELVQMTRGANWTGFDIAAAFSASTVNGTLEGVTQQPLAALAGYVETHTIDEAWIALPLEQSEKLREVLTQLRYCTANVRYAPDLFGLFLLNRGMTVILDVPMIDLTASPMQGWNQLLKGVEDRLLAAVILVLISPVMILIAVGVKLGSPGPVFYRQERVGWNGRVYQMLKFRSMQKDAEQQTGAMWANKQDGRATAFGKFIRRTSLDELPQFINVLKGEMSIVGPRPERPIFVEQFKRDFPGYMQKHIVKAGITGWAQVNGWRGRTDLNKRIEHDLYYIEHWSLWFDLKIIFLTLFKGFVNKNAY